MSTCGPTGSGGRRTATCTSLAAAEPQGTWVRSAEPQAAGAQAVGTSSNRNVLVHGGAEPQATCQSRRVPTIFIRFGVDEEAELAVGRPSDRRRTSNLRLGIRRAAPQVGRMVTQVGRMITQQEEDRSTSRHPARPRRGDSPAPEDTKNSGLE